MYRYFALIWNPAEPAATVVAKRIADRLRSSPAKWACVLTQEGVQALHAGVRPGSNEAYRLPDGAGIVFGKLFPAGRPVDVVTVQDLLRRYWGRYVALLRDGSTGEVRVLRDPTGTLPCLFATHEGVTLVFSDVEDLVALDVLSPSVNWKYIAAYVSCYMLQGHETGLNEVFDVLPGECLTFGRSGVESTLAWRPMDIALRDPIENANTATEAVRETVRTCVHEWASAYESIIHCLSGGLDSSIVLSCLQRAPSRPALLCLNYFATGRYEDERPYARTVARHMNAELLECQLDVAAVKLEKMLAIRRSARPRSYVNELLHEEFELSVATERGATAVFSGGGGDALFYQARADLAVADDLWMHGLRARLLRTLADAAVVSRLSYWTLLRRGLQASFRRKAPNPVAETIPPRTLVDPHVIRVALKEAMAHPWLLSAGEGPPGKQWHIASTSVPPAFYGSFEATGPDRVFPLVSQPLIELCLSIPTYVLISGGWDRAIARRAFAQDLPAEIVQRSHKGSIDQYSRNLLDANLDFARELLLDGCLVREGLLDREQLERYLSGRQGLHDYEYNEILHEHLCTEAWLRRWSESARRAAA